eukprot:2988459-Pleurochrysis_carterae.AAC.1
MSSLTESQSSCSKRMRQSFSRLSGWRRIVCSSSVLGVRHDALTPKQKPRCPPSSRFDGATDRSVPSSSAAASGGFTRVRRLRLLGMPSRAFRPSERGCPGSEPPTLPSLRTEPSRLCSDPPCSEAFSRLFCELLFSVLPKSSLYVLLSSGPPSSTFFALACRVTLALNELEGRPENDWRAEMAATCPQQALVSRAEA